MYIFANGDSYSYGHGLSNIGTEPRQWPLDHRDKIYALENSWPSQLAQLHNLDYVNLSKPGGSNDRIVRTTLQYFTGNHLPDPLVIIGWTGVHRRELHIKESIVQHFPNEPFSGYKTFTPSYNQVEMDLPNTEVARWSRRFTQFGWDNLESHVTFLQQVLLMQNYFDNRKIKYIFFLSFSDVHKWQYQRAKGSYELEMTESLYNAIDWQKFLGYNKNNFHAMDTWFEQQLCDEDWDSSEHPTLSGHQKITKILNRELIDRGWLNP
jgi:Family of unknown function (DUF6071)